MTGLESLSEGLVVFCQPGDDGPMDMPGITAAMARAAEAGGADGLRIEGLDNLATTRLMATLAIIAILKRDLDNSAVRITPFFDDVRRLAEHGADIIAYDPTQRRRPVPTAELVADVHAGGKIAMADCAALEHARISRGDGHVGFTTSQLSAGRCGSGRVGTVEKVAGGRAIAATAARRGHPGDDAKPVFEAHLAGEIWASELIARSTRAVAEFCANLAAILDRQRIALGGSIGPAEGSAALFSVDLAEEPALFRPEIVHAELGREAALIGILSHLV